MTTQPGMKHDTGKNRMGLVLHGFAHSLSYLQPRPKRDDWGRQAMDAFLFEHTDPNNRLPHMATVAWYMLSGIAQPDMTMNHTITQFSKALIEVGHVGTFGAEKYTPFGFLSVPNGVDRYTDAMMRHFLHDFVLDEDSGLPHLVHAAWNALARLELELRHDA